MHMLGHSRTHHRDIGIDKDVGTDYVDVVVVVADSVAAEDAAEDIPLEDIAAENTADVEPAVVDTGVVNILVPVVAVDAVAASDRGHKADIWGGNTQAHLHLDRHMSTCSYLRGEEGEAV